MQSSSTSSRGLRPQVLCFALLIEGAAAAVQTAPTTAPSASEAVIADPASLFEMQLLREGSQILEAPAAVMRDEKRRVWSAELPNDDPKRSARVLTLLPCARLSEIERHVEMSPASRFQLSGEVYVFRNRNYLLPTHAPVIEPVDATAVSAPTGPAPLDSVATTQPAASQPGAQASQPERDTAQAIIRDLETAAKSRSRVGTASKSQKEESKPAGSNRHGKLLREGTTVANRRGKLSRDGAGAWLFVFDADATGHSDPPVRLLPCLLLERIEDYARKQGNNSPALLNGTVYVYDGQNYLLPTVFRIPQERKNITP